MGAACVSHGCSMCVTCVRSALSVSCVTIDMHVGLNIIAIGVNLFRRELGNTVKETLTSNGYCYV